MEIVLVIVASLLPLAYWWRFKDTPLDRDFGPYAYCGVFNTGYFEKGMRDVKPPLIHLGYRVWLRLLTYSKLNIRWKLRLFPSYLLAMIILLLGLSGYKEQSVILALLLISPSLWPHMANTEWLSLSLIALGWMSLEADWNVSMPLLLLGMLPLVNQKNVLLIPVMVWALKLPVSWTGFTLLIAPTSLFVVWALMTGKWRRIILYLWTIPREMGKHRTLRRNTLQQFHLLMPFLYKFALVLTICDWRSPWFVMLLVCIGLTVSVKQVVPHHFILWALPLALSAKPTLLFFVAWLVLWLMQDFPIWRVPSLLYPITFRFRQGGHYGMLLEEGLEVVEWLKANTAPGEAILVNGFENQIYIEANRPAVCMDICEAPREADKIMPRVIVHCGNSAIELDYTGYEPQLITAPSGLYTVTVRKEFKL